jgi:hypothetical protein
LSFLDGAEAEGHLRCWSCAILQITEYFAP